MAGVGDPFYETIQKEQLPSLSHLYWALAQTNQVWWTLTMATQQMNRLLGLPLEVNSAIDAVIHSTFGLGAL